MSTQHSKFIVTTNTETGAIVSIERLGASGELVSVAPNALFGRDVELTVPGQVGKVFDETRPLKRAGVAASAPGIHMTELPEHAGVAASAPGIHMTELPEHAGVAASAPGIHMTELPEHSCSQET